MEWFEEGYSLIAPHPSDVLIYFLLFSGRFMYAMSYYYYYYYYYKSPKSFSIVLCHMLFYRYSNFSTSAKRQNFFVCFFSNFSWISSLSRFFYALIENAHKNTLLQHRWLLAQLVNLMKSSFVWKGGYIYNPHCYILFHALSEYISRQTLSCFVLFWVFFLPVWSTLLFHLLSLIFSVQEGYCCFVKLYGSGNARMRW